MAGSSAAVAESSISEATHAGAAVAKSNAKKCAEWRAKQPRKLALPMPEGTTQALAELMQWNGHDDEREAITTLIHQLHAMGPEGSRAALTVLRHQYEPTQEMADRLYMEGARSKGNAEDWR